MFNFGEEEDEHPANPLDPLWDEMDLGLEIVAQKKAEAEQLFGAPMPIANEWPALDADAAEAYFHALHSNFA